MAVKRERWPPRDGLGGEKHREGQTFLFPVHSRIGLRARLSTSGKAMRRSAASRVPAKKKPPEKSDKDRKSDGLFLLFFVPIAPWENMARQCLLRAESTARWTRTALPSEGYPRGQDQISTASMTTEPKEEKNKRQRGRNNEEESDRKPVREPRNVAV